jgi:cephalosporin hydroxylase
MVWPTSYQLIDCWFSPGNCCEAALKQLPPTPAVLELGSWEGASTTYWAERLHPSILVCVDTWQGSWEHADGQVAQAEVRFDANMQTAACQVEKIRDSTFDALPQLIKDGRKFDLVYVDASHTTYHTLHDLILALRLLRVGGVMAIDDYRWNWEDVAQGKVSALDIPKTAIDCFLQCYAPFVQITKQGYQVWLIVKQDFTQVKSLNQT